MAFSRMNVLFSFVLLLLLLGVQAQDSDSESASASLSELPSQSESESPVQSDSESASPIVPASDSESVSPGGIGAFPSDSESDSEVPSPSASASLSPASSPSPPRVLVQTPIDLTIPLSVIPVNTAFSELFVWRIPNLDITNPPTIIFTCTQPQFTQPTTLDLLQFQQTNAATDQEICAAVSIQYVNCDGYAISQPTCSVVDGKISVTFYPTTDSPSPRSAPPSRFYRSPKRNSRYVKSKGPGYWKNSPYRKPEHGGGENHNGGENRNGGGEKRNGGEEKEKNRGGENRNGGGENRNGGGENRNGGGENRNGGGENRNGGGGREEKKKDGKKGKKDDGAFSRMPGSRSAADEAITYADYTAPSTESSDSAYYAFLAVIPVAAGLAGFIWWRSRSSPKELNTFEFQPNQAPVDTVCHAETPVACNAHV